LAKALRGGVGDSVAIVGDAGIGNDDVGWGVVLLSFWSRATTVAASLSTSESSLATMSLEPSPLGRSLRASAAMSGSLAVAITATAALGMSLAVRPLPIPRLVPVTRKVLGADVMIRRQVSAPARALGQSAYLHTCPKMDR